MNKEKLVKPLIRKLGVALALALSRRRFIGRDIVLAILGIAWAASRSWRIVGLAGVALLAAALINEPWITLLGVSFAYLASVPFSLLNYGRVKRRRAAEAVPTPAG